ncbi:MAG: DUF3011 domain-containing protein [Lysobacteraceae bacterium]
MKTFRWILGLCVAMLAGQAFAQFDDGYDYYQYAYDRNDRTFECKSSGYDPNYCRVNTRNGVRLVRQLSTSACTQGRSWGFDERGVWVSNGCQARFAVIGYDRPDNRPGYGDANQGSRVVRCESTGRDRTRCRVDTRGGVQLVRQISSTSCRQGQNWSYDRDQIWVDNGCRADFRVGGYGGGGYDPGYGRQTIRCESNDNKTNRCRVDTRGGVRLVRQISSTTCRQGRNWGYDDRSIWVSRGCRADFQTGGSRR